MADYAAGLDHCIEQGWVARAPVDRICLTPPGAAEMAAADAPSSER